MSEIPEKIRKGQGQRVRVLRDILDLSRPKFAAQHPKLSKSSIRNWEEGQKSGLSEPGAAYLAEAAQRLGVNVSEDWLLKGAGKGPEKSPINLLMSDAPLAFELAVQVISQRHPQTLSLLVKDDRLAPALRAGEYVLGTRFAGGKLSQALNHLCIVETMEGSIDAGYLKRAAQGHYYLQKELDAPIGVGEPVNVLSAAPIILVMRKFED